MHSPKTHRRLWIPRLLAAVGLVGLVACGADGPVGPTAVSSTPPAGDQLLRLAVSCQASLLIGERAPCASVASYSSGRQPLVSFDSTWSSSRPEVVAVDSLGVSTGRSAGQAVVTASYQGQQASAVVAVTAEDALRIRAAAEQGLFRPGATVTMWLQGYYSLASAETGRLSLRISDQDGTIVTTAPMTVLEGGDFFLLSSTFVVPQTSSRVCRTAVLEVRTITITEPQSNDSGLWCVDVRP